MPLQRNATDHPLDVPAASATVQPGETLDWDTPIVGFELVLDEPDDPKPSPKSRKSTARPAGEEDDAR